MIRGLAPKKKWKPNPDGESRSIDQAAAIARAHGVVIPDYVEFFVDELRCLDNDITARGPKVTKAAGGLVVWDDLLNRFGKVPFIVRPDILESDEAIVAVFAHEIHELGLLKPLLVKGTLTIEAFGAHTSATNPGNFHDVAWEFGDAMVEKMRRYQHDQ